MEEPAAINSFSSSFSTWSVWDLISPSKCAPLPAMKTMPLYLVEPANRGTSWLSTTLNTSFSFRGAAAAGAVAVIGSAFTNTPAPTRPATVAKSFFRAFLLCVVMIFAIFLHKSTETGPITPNLLQNNCISRGKQAGSRGAVGGGGRAGPAVTGGPAVT